MRRVYVYTVSFLLSFALLAGATSMTSFADRIELEPNNSKSTAQWLKSGELLKGVFNRADDVDYFAISTYRDGDIRITVLSANADYIIEVTDFFDKRITSSTVKGDYSTFLPNQPKGVYFISLKNNNEHRWEDYQLQVHFADNVQSEYTTRFEPNDTRENAYPIKTAVTYHAVLEHRYDQDYYQFRMDMDGDIRVTFQSAHTRVSVQLLDSNGKVVASKTAEGDISLLAQRQAKGVYYVHIYKNDDSAFEASYSLHVLYPIPYVRHDLTTLEPNDTKDYSYPVTAGHYYHARFEHGQDVDYYTFESEISGDIYIHLITGDARFQVLLTNERDRTIVSATVTREHALIAERQPAGKYYVFLVPQGDEPQDAYDIQFNYPVIRPEHNLTTLEPNNIKESAYYIQPGQLYHADFESVLDIDWYSMTVEPGPIAFNFNVDNGETMNVSIHDRFGRRLEQRTFAEVSDWIYNAKERGPYFIRLNTSQNARSYSFRAEYEPGIRIFINGNTFLSNQPAIMKDGGTLVPLRDIFEALGAEVNWNQESQTIVAERGTYKITLQIGASTAYNNGVIVPLSTPAQIVGTSTMVPLRFVSEALGAEVKWDSERRTIYIED